MTSNTRLANRFLVLVAVVALHITIGCQSEPASTQEAPTYFPDQFEEEEVVWQHQPSLLPSDTSCLSRFFTQNQGLVGSPDFEGQPKLYVSGNNNRRFYWQLSSGNNAPWRCVHSKGTTFRVTDGEGPPFK